MLKCILCFMCFNVLMFYSKPSGKGERLIVLHAGGKEEWIAGKQFVLRI